MENNVVLTAVGEFIDRGRERAYRQAQARQEQRQRRYLWLVALLFYAGYGLWEASTAGGGWDSNWFLPRLGILLAGIGALSLESRLAEPLHRDCLAAAGLLLAGCCYAVLVFWRDSPDRSAGGLLLLVIGIYLFSPGRFALTALTALGCSLLGAVGLLAGKAAGIDTWIALTYLLPAHLLAALALVQLNRVRRLEYLQRQQLRDARERNRELLFRALPSRIARQMMTQPQWPLARNHAGAVVIFADLSGFSALSRQCSATSLVQYLDQLFSRLDQLAQALGVEKIKTLGDAWMGVAGLADRHSASREVAAALDLADRMVRACTALPGPLGMALPLRIGIHRGPLVAGVIGRQRAAFDIWGETVNTASRLQGMAQPGHILVSEACYLASPPRFQFGGEHTLRLRGCGELRARELLVGEKCGSDLSCTGLGTD